jgi:hypothetical protein
VHHGIFWRNEPLVVDRGSAGASKPCFARTRRSSPTTSPSTHETLGNAAQLAARIGATPEGAVGSFGLGCTVDLTVAELASRSLRSCRREPLVFGDGRPDRARGLDRGSRL